MGFPRLKIKNNPFLRPVWIYFMMASVWLSFMAPHFADAGPELLFREFASGQIKKGVRSIGMGGDGATWGNYSLVYKDADAALVDVGTTRFSDTGSDFSFTAAGAATPLFWDDAALYFIALSQTADDVAVWTRTPATASKPPSAGFGSNQAFFLKFAKPVGPAVSIGLLASHELSEMTLFPAGGGPAILYQTDWRPSGGAGVTWTPVPSVLAGVRVILNNDQETRTSGGNSVSGPARSNEYRAGVSWLPWDGGLLDVGVVGLQRSSAVDGSSSYATQPTFGAELAVLPRRFWVRAGRDETSWTGGVTLRGGPLKLDVAYLKNLAEIRTGGAFGSESDSVIGTLTFAFDKIRGD
jgi:hypothetical protein